MPTPVSPSPLGVAALPDPALVVLVGASGAGKSTWAAARYRAGEIVSSDALRSVAGSGPGDLDASVDAFDLLDRIVAARLRRGLTTVVDTLGLDAARRTAYLSAGRAAGMPCVAVLVSAAPQLCRARNAQRDRPVPAPALTRQLKAAAAIEPVLAEEGWDQVVVVDGGEDSAEPTGASGATDAVAEPPASTPAALIPPPRSGRLSVVLNLSRFPWGQQPQAWLREMALAADEAGFAGIALMDHLIQIPQVGRAWDPLPEPFVTLGLLAGLDTRLHLGTLVSPVTIRSAGVLAKTVATLDALTGGRAFCGVGAGWFEREHAAYGLPFPPASERVDAVESAVETMRALWAPGTKAYAGRRVALPETTLYPRPVGDPPVVVGGSGERMLRIAARLGNACNVRSDLDLVARATQVIDAECTRVGRDRDEVAVTVLDTPVIGRDRDDVWARVERLRGRTAAATFAARHHAGTVDEQVSRYHDLAAAGVSTVFLALPDLDRPDELAALAPLTHA